MTKWPGEHAHFTPSPRPCTRAFQRNTSEIRMYYFRSVLCSPLLHYSPINGTRGTERALTVAPSGHHGIDSVEPSTLFVIIDDFYSCCDSFKLNHSKALCTCCLLGINVNHQTQTTIIECSKIHNFSINNKAQLILCYVTLTFLISLAPTFD